MGTSWLRRLSPASESAAHTLVCFPHAGGSAISMGALARSLGPEYEVFAVQYPGRQDRRHEPLVHTIAGLVDGLFPELLDTIRAADEFSLFGHSMGSVVAFEACRRLERESAPAATTLFASGRRAPSWRRPADRTAVHTLGDRELCDHLLSFGGTPAALLDDPEFRALILSVTRNDYRAIETYECTSDAVVACPLVALTGDRDPDASPTDIEAWHAHTAGNFAATSFPGGHFFIDANARAVAELIREHSSALSR
ncbi:thioesterase II family protein [Nocardia spumae]|uniref:thioesterase II family protein n=1 Tax=Nocardia spumae TaxID=2887190 RepID=UPI001D1477AC|nr:alpha/beta fold hydrolase [Nocardia spumae]